MTVEAAQAFLDRVKSDKTLANEPAGMVGDPEALVARVREAGFDVSLDELREATLDRYGATLTVEQLEALAAGADGWGVDFVSFMLAGSW
jgi:predicted ribosomally synthesized peptide with nif11-like leader